MTFDVLCSSINNGQFSTEHKARPSPLNQPYPSPAAKNATSHKHPCILKLSSSRLATADSTKKLKTARAVLLQRSNIHLQLPVIRLQKNRTEGGLQSHIEKSLYPIPKDPGGYPIDAPEQAVTMNGFSEHGLDESAFGEKSGNIVQAFDAFCK